ncbi:MAG: AraC family transcriptional regulator [Chitinophagaceae bacterium]|nr:MAG: AraC family transcriptional regulator [Chitinophagaceae bacterium]
MSNSHLLKIDSLTQLHSLFGLDKPRHPLVSVVKLEDVDIAAGSLPDLLVLNFYKVAYKMDLNGSMKYGQNYYDFGEGGLLFTAPNQPFQSPDSAKKSGFLLFFHPDFLQSYPLAKKINQYGFFSYKANEALHLSEAEKVTVVAVLKIIQEELDSRIDDYSQEIVISQIELLLNYSHRFYKRQFITRKAVNSKLLDKMETMLDDYFNNDEALQQGLPTVQYLADHLHLSAGYLSDMLRSLTGQNAQQHIHYKLIEKAKELLSTTELSVSEVAYQLGFEHPQSFNKLFKTKAKLSPLAFRQSFN